MVANKPQATLSIIRIASFPFPKTHAPQYRYQLKFHVPLGCIASYHPPRVLHMSHGPPAQNARHVTVGHHSFDSSPKAQPQQRHKQQWATLRHVPQNPGAH
jgi:hypothetical protein